MGQTTSLMLICSTDFIGDMITSIVWLDPAGQSVESTAMATSLGLTFDPISDDLNDTKYTCTVTHSNGSKYMEAITLSVEG